jgi:hypothetical protein
MRSRSLRPDRLDELARLVGDFAYYAPRILRIRTKSGSIIPFSFNKAQRFIHSELEDQRKACGRVRALILKGRQQGCSTYVGGRFYHQTTHRLGVRTFILTHEDAATQNLFEMVNRYHEHCHPAVKPSTSAANAKELFFDRLDSGYKVGTAGTKGVGRSSTIQLFHGSECAFWPNAETHAAGVLQAVPDEPGTEIILESTANGVGNFFHNRWRDAEAGIGEFIAIFVPWFWQEEYRKPFHTNEAAAEFERSLSDEEMEYGNAYDLNLDQLAWRRSKIAELGDPSLFKQEYPATSAEAFQMSGHDSFIAPEIIVKARKELHEGYGPLVVGFDPAWTGADRSAMAWRQGRRLLKVEARSGLDTMQSAGWCKQVLDKDNPARMFIDVGGVGAGVYDRLCEMGYRRKVVPVNFGGAPLEPSVDGGGPLNRRAEIWMRSKEWLQDPAGVDIPDADEIQADACGPTYRYDSMTRLIIEKKEDMRKRGVKSPDLWDAVALTFSEYLPPALTEEQEKDRYTRLKSRWGEGSSQSWQAA